MNDGGREAPSVEIRVPLSEEELAAVEGWRKANNVASQGDAIRALVRLGLLSEIGRIYQSDSNVDDLT